MRMHVDGRAIMLILLLVIMGVLGIMHYEHKIEEDRFARETAENDKLRNLELQQAREKAQAERREKDSAAKVAAEKARLQAAEERRRRDELARVDSRKKALEDKERLLELENQKKRQAQELVWQQQELKRKLEMDAAREELKETIKAIHPVEARLEQAKAKTNLLNSRVKGACNIKEQQLELGRAECRAVAQAAGDSYGSGGIPWNDYPGLWQNLARKTSGGGVGALPGNNTPYLDQMRLKYEAADREQEKWTTLLKEAQAEEAGIEKELAVLKAKKERLTEKTKGSLPAEESPEQSTTIPAPPKTFVLNNGTRITAIRAVDFGEEYGVKTATGEFLKVAKKDLKEILEEE